MTTAARPTLVAARAGRTVRDNPSHPVTQFSVYDLPAYTMLKFRQPGQNSAEEVRKRDLREELRRAEEEYRREKALGGKKSGDKNQTKLAIEADRSASSELGGEEHTEEAASSSVDSTYEQAKREALERARILDADEDDDDDNEKLSKTESDEEEEESDEEDEDDTAELLRELEKIKSERAAQKAKEEREREEREAKLREEEILTGNPLLNTDFTLKRRWDDDVVFKNQASNIDEKPKKRFVNDLLRSDFHRKFMQKYVQ